MSAGKAKSTPAKKSLKERLALIFNESGEEETNEPSISTDTIGED
jgi:hypothetical protein